MTVFKSYIYIWNLFMDTLCFLFFSFLLFSPFFFLYNRTNHLDLESVVALADACQKFPGAIFVVFLFYNQLLKKYLFFYLCWLVLKINIFFLFFPGAIVFVSHDEYFCAKVLTSLWKCNGTSVIQIHGGFQGYKESVRDGFAWWWRIWYLEALVLSWK